MENPDNSASNLLPLWRLLVFPQQGLKGVLEKLNNNSFI